MSSQNKGKNDNKGDDDNDDTNNKKDKKLDVTYYDQLKLNKNGDAYDDRIQETEKKIDAPAHHEPGWAKSLENILDDSTSKILDLQKEVFQLSEAITRHISETNARLDKLEKN